MRRRIRTLAGAGLLFCGVSAQAQRANGGVAIGATSRIRVEAIDGQARAGFNDSDELLNVRTTVSAEYETDPVRLVAELWDSRVYGANRGPPVSPNEVNALELVQAFAEFRLGEVAGAKSTATLQIGRYLLNIGSRRLVAADDYRNTTNGYTGVRGDIAVPSGWRATLLYMLPQQRRPDDLEALLDNDVGPITRVSISSCGAASSAVRRRSDRQRWRHRSFTWAKAIAPAVRLGTARSIPRACG